MSTTTGYRGRLAVLIAAAWLAVPGCGPAGDGDGDGAASRDASPPAEESGSRGPTDGPASDGLASGPVGDGSGRAWFEDMLSRSGVDFVHESGRGERPFFPEIMGGGTALLDIDGDNDLDLYLVQSGTVHDPGGEGGTNRLYRNRGDGRFDDITETSGAGDRGYGMGVAVGDYDNDGDPDLYVTNWGRNTLLQNQGDGTFRDVTDAAGVGHEGWGTSVSFADLDGDGDLDLFVTNYVAWTPETELECLNPQGIPDYCLPLSYETPSHDTLYRNDGDGTFTDVSQAAGIAAAVGYGLGVVCTDFDGDGLTDIFVANDSVFNHLWMNRGNLVFEDEALFRGCAVDEDGVAKAGMGVMAVDYDDDGDEDLIVMNLERQSDSFYRNEDGIFYDHTAAIGLGFRSRKYTRFGVGFQDFNQDGWLDLYIANGRVTLPSETGDGDPYAEANLLFRGGPDGKMEEVLPQGGTSRLQVYTSRSVAFGDINGDGAVDLVVGNRDGPPQLLVNVTQPRGRRVTLRVEEASGRAALGARVEGRIGSRTVTRIVQSGFGYQSASDSRLTVGLGAEEMFEAVTVTWPDGEEELFGHVPAGTTRVLRRGEGV